MGPLFKRITQEYDVCISQWLNNKDLNGLLSPFQSMVGTGLLSDEYIPEPYYGDPDDCSAVVININPGSKSATENVKYWGNANNPNSPLIWDLGHTFSGKYSQFQSKYSPFTAPSWVPGVDWWAANRVDFIKRIVSFYRQSKGLPSIDNRNPLAMELCPLHSANTNGLNFCKKEYLPHYQKNVFIPAQEAIKASLIPFGMGFASSIDNVLNRCGYTNVLIHWKDGQDYLSEQKSQIPNWPKKANGDYKIRTYKLIQNEDGCAFLMTWDNSGKIIKVNEKMMAEYQLVDVQLMQAIAKIL